MSIQLHMATTSVCNARCHFCIYKSPENTRPKGFMDWDLYTKIIDEAADIPVITDIAFSALGEPLLDPLLVDRVAYVKKKCPHWNLIEVYTNGTMLNPEKFRALRDAGVNGLSFSLNAVSAEQHERVMGLKGKYATVCANADYAVKNAGPGMLIRVKAVFSEDDRFSDDHMARFYTTWGIVGRPMNAAGAEGNGQVVIERNWAGASRTLQLRIKDFNECCGRALGQVSILHDGTVSLCCFDPLAKHNLGDLNTQSLRDIYMSPWYTQFREDHFSNQAAKYEMCAACTRI